MRIRRMVLAVLLIATGMLLYCSQQIVRPPLSPMWTMSLMYIMG